MMRKITLALLALLTLTGLARADYVVKDGNGATQTIKAGDLSGVILPWNSPVDATGAAIGVSANPLFTAPAPATSWAVTGTFWQATQPVSGTFWQATQPVSIATMPSTPVTGTFWQATQPVSAAALPLPAGAATSANQSTEITSLGTINTTLGTPLQTGGSVVANGGVASGAADSGNPVKIGGVNRTTRPTLTDGLRGDLQFDTRANVAATLYAPGSTNSPLFNGSTLSDGLSNVVTGISAQNFNMIFNGTTWDRVRGDITGGAWSQGAIASGAADTGNPVKVGAKYNVTKPTFTDLQRGDMQIDSRGTLQVSTPCIQNGTNCAGIIGPNDGQSAGNSLSVVSFPVVWNGTTWDRTREVIGDAQAATGITASGGMLWNGTTYDRATGTAAAGAYVAGAVASGATDTGNPVKVGGISQAVAPTLADGQRGNLAMDNFSGVYTVLKRPGTATMVGSAASMADTTSNTANTLNMSSYGLVFNGTTWDRLRSMVGQADASTGIGTVSSGVMLYNGTNYDRARGTNGAASVQNVGINYQLSPTITVQNAAYAAGNSLGGLITVTGAARVNGGTGILDALRLKSTGGATNVVWIYAWSKTPVATCTDKTAYVASASDNAFQLPGFPASVTLGGAPGAWDTATYAQLNSLVANYKNQDSSPGTAIYLCLISGGAVTPATTGDLTLVAGGIYD